MVMRERLIVVIIESFIECGYVFMIVVEVCK